MVADHQRVGDQGRVNRGDRSGRSRRHRTDVAASEYREVKMLRRSSTAAGIATAATLLLTLGAVQAADDAKYPDWNGQWSRVVVPAVEGGAPNPGFDPHKPRGRGQQAPLTPEYAKVLDDSIADQAKGGLGRYPSARCIPSGMPRMMTFYEFEYVITPDTTYILVGGDDHYRRISAVR
jgi:hypothetical protein